MKRFLSGPDGQIFALICVSFGAGAGMITTLQLFLRGDASWMVFAVLTVLLCVVIVIAAVSLRKAIP
jgi:hypothetical protein